MSTKLPTIKERILQLSENVEVTKQDFFKKIEITYGNFTGDKKKTPLNSNAIENILRTYPQTNSLWLLTGKGEMLLKEPIETPAVEQVPDAGHVHAVEMLEKEVATLKEALKEAYKESGRLELYLEQAKEAIVALKKSGAGVGVSELKSK